jgi:hypothetical protein
MVTGKENRDISDFLKLSWTDPLAAPEGQKFQLRRPQTPLSKRTGAVGLLNDRIAPVLVRGLIGAVARLQLRAHETGRNTEMAADIFAGKYSIVPFAEEPPLGVAVFAPCRCALGCAEAAAAVHGILQDHRHQPQLGLRRRFTVDARFPQLG